MNFIFEHSNWVALSYDALAPGRRTLIGTTELIAERFTPYQHLAIAEVPGLGRGLFLDGNVQLLAEGELVYHERLALLPVLAHPEPRHVLILGGGDGCAVREVLRDPRVESVTLVEIDEAVITACADHLAELNQQSLSNPRVRLVVQDARIALVSLPLHTFDVVIVDFLDLYTSADLELYDQVLHMLATSISPTTTVSLHGDLANPPYWSALRLHALAAHHFTHVLLHSAFVPCYQSEWGFLLAGAGDALVARFTPEGLRLNEAALTQPLQTIVVELFPTLFRTAPQRVALLAQLATEPFQLPTDHRAETRWIRLER